MNSERIRCYNSTGVTRDFTDQPETMADWLRVKKTHMSPFRFSRVWEDHRLISAALDIQPDQDKVLCITSAGDNVLNLLLEEPKTIVAVDVNPAENALLELKIAAIKHLSYEDYLLVLGDKEDSTNNTIARTLAFEQIQKYLPKYAKEYFSSEIVKRGISTSGRFQEDTVQLVINHLSKAVEANDLDEFFTASTIEEQRKCFQKISTGLEKVIMSCLTREHVLTTGWTEEQLTDLEAIHGDVSQFFLKHFHRVCLTLPSKDNFYFSLLTRGVRRFSPDTNPELSPPFLQRKNFQKLKQLINRIEVFTGLVQDYFMQSSVQTTINKVYLSDIFERVELGLAQSILKAVICCMPPGGRIAYCTLLEPKKPPSPATLERVTYLEELSTELQEKDRMVLYSGFYVFSVK